MCSNITKYIQATQGQVQSPHCGWGGMSFAQYYFAAEIICIQHVHLHSSAALDFLIKALNGSEWVRVI